MGEDAGLIEVQGDESQRDRYHTGDRHMHASPAERTVRCEAHPDRQQVTCPYDMARVCGGSVRPVADLRQLVGAARGTRLARHESNSMRRRITLDGSPRRTPGPEQAMSGRPAQLAWVVRGRLAGAGTVFSMLLTIKDLAGQLRIKPSTLYAWASQSKIPCIRIHGLIRIRELNWNAVDFFRKTVTVFRSKNGERRTIPINSLVLDVLKRKAKVRSIKSEYVFPSDTFTLLDDSHLRRAFRGAIRLCRIENFHFHDLRHTFATRLVQSGIDLYKVQCLLGHKSPIMTQRYAHHYPESLREGVEMLERYRLTITGGTNLAHMAQAAGPALRRVA